ncbi:MAG: hypothetical protein Q9226_008861 [Calogaya cf. arnoldii]
MDVKIVGANIVSYNGWVISGCGTSEGLMTPKLNSILGFLFQIKPHIEAVIADAKLGTRSSHGYTAFFKSNTNMRAVINKYQALLDVSPVIVSAERAKFIGTHTPQPSFQCIKEDDPESADIMARCNRTFRSDLTSHYPAIVHTGTERISICPDFYKTKQYPAPKQYCPTLGANGNFKPADGSLMTNGFAYMVYALVKMYNRELYTTYINSNRLLDMQHAVELKSRQSLLSAESYGFYAGGESERNGVEWISSLM